MDHLPSDGLSGMVDFGKWKQGSPEDMIGPPLAWLYLQEEKRLGRDGNWRSSQ